VISGEQIRERGITSIEQLFRGEVPGLFAPRVTAGSEFGQGSLFSRGSTSLEFGTGTVGPKIFVDNVEMASDQFFTAIDPNSIERIEIIAGPQAANLYGNGAMAGVVHVFLKKGRFGQRPTLRGSFAAGAIETDLSSDLTPQQNHSLTLTGGEERFSYDVTGSFDQTGEWRPGISSRQVSGSAGARLQQGWFIADVTARVAERRTTGLNAGFRGGPIAERRATGEFAFSASDLIPSDRPSTLGTQTLSLTLRGTPRSWWEQRLVIGRDASDARSRPNEPNFTSPSDSLYTVLRNDFTVTTAKYSSTFRAPAWRGVRADATVAFDLRRSNFSGLFVLAFDPDGDLQGPGGPSVTITDVTERGYIGQLRVAIGDALFLTGGFRLQDNPNFGEDYGLSYAPSYGASYAFPAFDIPRVGSTAIKLRAAYGRAIRAPAEFAKVGSSPRTSAVFGTFRSVLPNPEIGPEEQRGTEFGIDAFFAERLSMQLTRFDQTVDGLIVSHLAGRHRSLEPDPVTGEFSFMTLSRFANLASIKNEGWEAQASLRLNRLVLAGAFTQTESRVLSIDPRYDGDQRPGDFFPGVADRTGALSVRYRDDRLSGGVIAHAVGHVPFSIFDTEAFRRCREARLPVTSDRTCFDVLGTGTRIARGYWTVDADFGYRLTSTLTPFVRLENLSNVTRNDTRWGEPVQGRVTVVGVRVR
jgi:TonB-dependent Receptor Plug Domain